MRKLIPVITVLIIGAVVFYFINTSNNASTTSQSNQAAVTSNTPVQGTSTDGSSTGGAAHDGLVTGESTGDTEVLPEEEETRPATEVYKSADEAMKAIRAGAVDYDDRILEQFTEVGEDCTWCDTVYAQIKDLMVSPETPSDQRSYYGELLAVSGRVANVESLVQAIKNAPNQETADALSEALELTIGKSDVTQFLGDQIPTANESLKESLIAAVTNQGSRLAVDVLYKNTVEKGDPDGYYSLGIGLGELVPDESAMPYLQELVNKRDPYSHLAVKSLLNGGIDGLKLVMSSITNSPNPENDAKMLKDAVDHVPLDDEVNEYLTKLVETDKDPLVQKFAKDILDSAKAEAEADAEGEAEVDMNFEDPGADEPMTPDAN